MRFFYCLILLSYIFVKYSVAINNNNYIPCTSHCSAIKISFSKPLTFPTECQPNDQLTGIYANALLCIIEYRIDYTAKTIDINFQATNDTSMINAKNSGEYLIQEIRLNVTNFKSPHYTTFRRYGCTSNKDCARDFYLSTISDLVNGGRTIFSSIKKKLNKAAPLISLAAKRHCINSAETGSSKSEKCGHGICYVYSQNYTLSVERNTKSQTCDEKFDQFLFSSIEYHSPQQIEKDKEILEYRCNKNVCNRDDFFHKTQGMISNYTRWTPTITRDDIITNTKTTQNSSMPQTVSSYIVVLFIILIQLFI